MGLTDLFSDLLSSISPFTDVHAEAADEGDDSEGGGDEGEEEKEEGGDEEGGDDAGEEEEEEEEEEEPEDPKPKFEEGESCLDILY